MIPQIGSKSLVESRNTDYNSNGSSSNDSNNQRKPAYDQEKNTSAKSGYSADGSAAVSAPPVYIDFLDANKRDGESDENNTSGQSRSSRRRAVELSFTASRAMEDLKKGNLTIPTIRMEKRRDLDGHKVDMTKVKLMMAKSVSSSPFLFDRGSTDMKLVPDTANEYESLFAATYQSYEKPEVSHCDSSTSSVTSSESDDATGAMPPPALVIPPLLEDALKANAAMKTGVKLAGSKRKRQICTDTALAKAIELSHITMNDALEASNEAR